MKLRSLPKSITSLAASLIVLSFGMTGTGQVLFHDGFEKPQPGRAPRLGAPVGNTAGSGVIVHAGPYSAGEIVGPEQAFAGNNYLVLDRLNRGGNDFLCIFAGEPLTLAEVDDLTARFHVWIPDREADTNASFGLSNSSSFNADSIAAWMALDGPNGDAGFGPQDFFVWNGSGWEARDITSEYLVAQWNQVEIHYDGTALTATVNDGSAIDLIYWGGIDLFIDRFRFRSGSGNSTLFLDEVSVVINGAEIPAAQEPVEHPARPALGETVTLFMDGLENSVPGEGPGTEDPDIGEYEYTGVGAVVVGPDGYANAFGPDAARSGDNFLVIDRANLGGIEFSMLFQEYAGDHFFAGEFADIEVEFYMWVEDGIETLPNFGLAGARTFSQGTLFNWAGVGQFTSVAEGTNFFSYTGSAWDTFDMGDNWTGAAWNKVVIRWDAAADTLTAAINTGDPFEISTWGGLGNTINQIYLRGGIGSTIGYFDDIKVTGTLQERQCPVLAAPGDLSGEIILNHGFEPDGLEVGELETTGTVVTGQYSAGDILGPQVGNSGENYLALESGQNLRGVFGIDPFAFPGDPETVAKLNVRFYLWTPSETPGGAVFAVGNGTDFVRGTLSGPNDDGTGKEKDFGNWTGNAWEYSDIGAEYIPGQPETCSSWNLIELEYDARTGEAIGRVNGGETRSMTVLGDSISDLVSALSVESTGETVYFVDDIQAAVLRVPPAPVGGAGTTIFRYTFEDSVADGELPLEEDPEVGTLSGIAIQVFAGEYTGGAGPLEAAEGEKYGAYNRSDASAGRTLDYVWDPDLVPFQSLSELSSWRARMYVWIEAGNNNWGLASSRTPFDGTSLPFWGGYHAAGEGDSLEVAALSFNGAWGRTPVTSDWKEREWNKIVMEWTPEEGMILQANDGARVPLPDWIPGMGATTPINFLYHRAGDGGTDHFVDDIIIVVNGELPDPELPGTLIFSDDFEGNEAGAPPTSPLVGSYDSDGQTAPVISGPYLVGDVVGPVAGNSGMKYLEFDRASNGGRELNFIFDLMNVGGEAFTLASKKAMHLQFYAWMDPGFVSYLNLGAANGRDFDTDTIVWWGGIGGNPIGDDMGPRPFLHFTDAWVQTPVGEGDWIDSEWNKVNISYDSRSGELTGQINDGETVLLAVWGDPATVPLNRIRARTGTGTTRFFIDDLKVSVEEIQVVPVPEAGPVFGDGFENSGLDVAPADGDPDLGTYATTGNFVTVISGPDPLNGDSPESANSGDNHVGFDDTGGGFGNPTLSAVLASTPSSFVASSTGLIAEFAIWIAASDDSVATFQIGNGIGFNPNSQLLATSIGGANLVWSWWNGEAWVDTGASLNDRDWNTIRVVWNGSTFTGTVNDGEPVALGLFGTPDNRISRLLFGRGEGSAESIYYLDDIQAELVSLGPPGDGPSLAISSAGGQIMISWDAAAAEGMTLRSSAAVDGEYTDAGLEVTVDGGVASVTIVPEEAAQYYLLVGE